MNQLPDNKYEILERTILSKTDKGDILYFANLTDKQFWWDTDPFYSAFLINDEMFKFIQNNIPKRKQLAFDENTETYMRPVNIIKVWRTEHNDCENSNTL